MTNIIGEKVVVKTLTSAYDQQIEMDLSNVSDGVYFVTISSENEVVSKKLVVKK